MNAVQEANKLKRLEMERQFVMKGRAGVSTSTQKEAIVTPIRSEDQTVAEINSLHVGIQNGLNAIVRNALRIGELLICKKAELKHGEFRPWIEANCSFKRTMALNYMHLYEKSLVIPAISEANSYREALKILTNAKEDEAEKELNQPPKQPSVIFAEFRSGKNLSSEDKKTLAEWLLQKESYLKNQAKQIKQALLELQKNH